MSMTPPCGDNTDFWLEHICSGNSFSSLDRPFMHYCLERLLNYRVERKCLSVKCSNMLVSSWKLWHLFNLIFTSWPHSIPLLSQRIAASRTLVLKCVPLRSLRGNTKSNRAASLSSSTPSPKKSNQDWWIWNWWQIFMSAGTYSGHEGHWKMSNGRKRRWRER